MDFRASERMMMSSCLGGIILGAVGNRMQSFTLSAAGAALMVLGILQTLKFFRCPHCKKRFKFLTKSPKVCPYCGAELEAPSQTAEAKQVEVPAEETEASEAAEEPAKETNE